jgi:Carboxypeptidase regulatory-like domain
MSRRLLVAVVVGLLGLAAPALARADGTISGVVTDVAQTPIAGLCVVADEPGNQDFTAQTAADGSYAIDVPAGSYVVDFSACETNQNFVTQWYPNQADETSAQPISVAEGQTVSGIDAMMQPGGQISVQAVDADTGAPLTGGVIALWTPGADEADPTFPTSGDALEVAPSSGSIAFSDLPAGTYLVEAAGSEAGNEAHTWYPDVPDPAHSQLIQLGSGQTVNLTLPFFHGGAISGTVTGEGRAIPKAEVRASMKEPDGSVYSAGGANTLPNGQFTAPDIAPGRWTITASAGSRWVPQSRATQIVENGSQSSDFRLPRGPAVDDRIPVRLRRLHVARHRRTITITGRISERHRVAGRVTLSFGRLFPGRHTVRLTRFTSAGGRFRVTVHLPRGRRLLNPRLFVDITQNHAYAAGRFERRLPRPRR